MVALGTRHIIGGGLAGLAAAERLARHGARVELYEAAPGLGGRCRSFFDAALDAELDNGSHVLIRANTAVVDLLHRAGVERPFTALPAVPMIDLRDGTRFALPKRHGPAPFWLLAPGRIVPGACRADGWRALAAMARPTNDATVTDAFGGCGALYNKLLEPLALAILNTPAERASAALFVKTMRLATTGPARRGDLLVFRQPFASGMIGPLERHLRTQGVTLHTGMRLEALHSDADRIVALQFRQQRIALSDDDHVILAVPQGPAAGLLPDLQTPAATQAIVNGHFRLPDGGVAATPLTGLIGGSGQWLFQRDGIASVTVSAADDLAAQDAGVIARLLWHDAAQALGLPPGPLPAHRIVKEKRATFAQTPAGLARRPGANTRYRNLTLAGDWTATGLPATLEGAVRSGRHAAARALQRRQRN
ncbi:MAG: hydroxysqualene dehydroxylase HpnE [Geminicoccaceae bacterium]